MTVSRSETLENHHYRRRRRGGAALEMPRRLRVNVVSPGLLDVSAERDSALFPGHERVASERVGRAYAESVEGALTGRVIAVD